MKKHTKYENMDIINVDEYEDIIDIRDVRIVSLKEDEEVLTNHDMYIPVSYMGEEPVEATVYTLNKEFFFELVLNHL